MSDTFEEMGITQQADSPSERLSPAPSEPREPAAREWLNENRVKFLTGETVYPYGHSKEKIEYLDEAAMLAAYSAELRANLDAAKDANHRAFVAGAKWWEFSRPEGGTMWPSDQHLVTEEAEKRWPYVESMHLRIAEARVKELETADIQRAKDITRLTIERDDYRHKWNDVLAHEDKALANCRKLERSLLQARELLKSRLERALADARDINDYAVKDGGGRGERLLKVAGHTTGMIIRLERELASTSAPARRGTK